VPRHELEHVVRSCPDPNLLDPGPRQLSRRLFEVIRSNMVRGERQHGILPASGPVRDRHEARLHITGVVRGSFGFELADLVQG
jgi:hypothetical protein